MERYETRRAKLTKKGGSDEELAKLATEHRERLQGFDQAQKELVEAEQKDALETKRLKEDEARRQKDAEREIAALSEFRHPRARSRGAFSLGVGAGMSSAPSPTMGGVALGLRHAFWFEPPAEGLASGLELRANAQGFDGRFLGDAAAGPMQLAQGGGELRFWKSRLGVGAALDYRMLAPDVAGADAMGALRAGPTLSFALVDSHQSRVIIGGRWLPLINSGMRAGAADLELGWRFLSAGIQAGTLPHPDAPDDVDLYVAGTVGARLRW